MKKKNYHITISFDTPVGVIEKKYVRNKYFKVLLLLNSLVLDIHSIVITYR